MTDVAVLEADQTAVVSTHSRGRKALDEILVNVNSIIRDQANKDSPDKDVLTSCANIITGTAALSKSFPTGTKTSFRLNRQEYFVLITYAIGGLSLMWAIPHLITDVTWTGADVLSILLYWTTILAVLLGASVLPKIASSSAPATGS